MLDLRAPIGWLFIILGILVAGAGWLNPVSTQFGAGTVNLNLVWGSAMGVFGLGMTGLAWLGKDKGD